MRYVCEFYCIFTKAGHFVSCNAENPDIVYCTMYIYLFLSVFKTSLRIYFSVLHYLLSMLIHTFLFKILLFLLFYI